MMHEREKSDLPIVPVKSANKAERSAAESMEGSGGAKRNASPQSTVRAQSRDGVSQAQARIREAVSRNPEGKLTTLLHHITVDTLRSAFLNLKKRAAVGVDQVTWGDYAADLERNLTDLAARVHRGAYRALPSRRVFIPKADVKLRPLGIAAIEDKIVQAAVVMILTPVYEAEFSGASYGFRHPAGGMSSTSCRRHVFDMTARTARCAGRARVRDQDTQRAVSPRRRYLAVLGYCFIMPPGSCGFLEEFALPGYHFDAESFLFAARDVDGFKLAALDTLQDGLARDAEGAHGLAHG